MSQNRFSNFFYLYSIRKSLVVCETGGTQGFLFGSTVTL